MKELVLESLKKDASQPVRQEFIGCIECRAGSQGNLAVERSINALCKLDVGWVKFCSVGMLVAEHETKKESR